MIPPPPPSEPPDVPVRRAAAVARMAGIQTLGRRPPAQLPVSAAYVDSDSSDTPARFLMHTASGNVFVPSGKCSSG